MLRPLESRPRSLEKFSAMTGSLRPERPRRSPARTGRGWWAVAGIAIAVLVVVAVLAVVVPRPRAASTASSDLCGGAAGPNCQGYQTTLPYEVGGVVRNVSQCDEFGSSGRQPELVFNYSEFGTIYGVVVPQPYYDGVNLSFLYNPYGYLHDAWAVSQTAWIEYPTIGIHAVNITLPSIAHTWCLAWWNPGTTGEVTLTTDVDLYP